MNIETSIPDENEYPIIWFDKSNFDSEEKMVLKLSFRENKMIHLFSEFEEAAKFAQSLGISFLLMVWNDGFDEQKLFKDFGVLQNTLGRRLTDFEEESLLKELSRNLSVETVKTFKVYVFFTRRDFESEDIEGMMMKPDTPEVARGFREEYLFWERKQQGLGKADAVFEDSKHGFDEFFKEEDCLRCKEFCMKRLRELIKKRRHEKEKIIYYVNLGESSRQLEEYQKALEYHGKALDILKSIYGEGHPSVGREYNGIANVYYSMEEFEKALEYFTKVLDIRKPVYEETHPSIASSYYNIALANYFLNDYKKSLELHLKALEIRKAFYGERHPNIASSYQGISAVYEQLKEYQNALDYSQKAMEINLLVYGETHAFTANSFSGFAEAYRNLNQHKIGLEYHLKALYIYKLICGEKHVKTVESYNVIAIIFYDLGEYENSLNYHLKTLKIKKSLYGETHESTAHSHYSLGMVYNALESYRKAKKHHLKALNIRISIYGEINNLTAASYYQLAETY